MPNVPEHIQNATIVITGASSGFGRGAALALAGEGANVVVAARRRELLDELISEIQGKGGSALAVPTDVSSPEDVERLGQRTIDEYGRIDVWVNNVGVGAIGNLWEIPLARSRPTCRRQSEERGLWGPCGD